MKRRDFVSALAALGIGSPGAAAERATAGEPFDFAVIGDVFSRSEGVEEASQLLVAIAQTKAKLILDVGSIKSDDERCSDELLQERVALFNASTLPLVPVAAQSEWLSCSQAKEGGFDAEERLEALRQNLFSGPQSLGSDGIGVARESGLHQFRPYAENVRFEFQRILFLTLNVPSPNDDYRLAGGRNGEFEDRVIANRAWIERSFHYADMMHLPGIVIAIEGDPEFARPLRAPDHRSARRDGFYELKTALRDAVARYHGQVLLLHSSAAGFLIDQPLQDAAGKPIRNFTRVRAISADYAGAWLNVTVDGRTPRVFKVDRVTPASPPSA
jgi:hypothetical protein